MSKRAKKPPVTPAEGPCPEGLKTFDVTVVETFNHHYMVYAKDRLEAEEIAEEKCNAEEFSPSTEGDSEFDRSIDAEETVLRVVDLNPDGYLMWKGGRYPYWTLRKGRKFARVSTVGLQMALYGDGEECTLSKPTDPEARGIDGKISFYASNDEWDSVDAVTKEIFG